MGTEIDYKAFLDDLDLRLEKYFQFHSVYVCCKKGCSACCEKGDYPLSELELRYLMQGYFELDNLKKQQVQKNINEIKKGGKCPFLINKECSIYEYRPIICRTHGLAYLTENDVVKVPYCANNSKNYKNVYKDEVFSSEPIRENLNTPNLLKDLEYGEIRNLYDWINHN